MHKIDWIGIMICNEYCGGDRRNGDFIVLDVEAKKIPTSRSSGY